MIKKDYDEAGMYIGQNIEPDNDDLESRIQDLKPDCVDYMINMTPKRRAREKRLMFAGAVIGSIIAIIIGCKVGGIIGLLTAGLLLIPLVLLGMLIGVEFFIFTEPGRNDE